MVIAKDGTFIVRRQFGTATGSCIGVAALANPTMRVEIRATAVIDDDG
jgi:enamine deaminase RidA (YjgF/YER057c/UK114 family)